MKKIAIILCTLALSACATAKKTYTPDGREGFAINCSGQALSWGKCYQKAGEICGTKGYDIISRSGDQGSTVAANQFGLYGGSVITRDLVIACKR